jgi:hypothetical protein
MVLIVVVYHASLAKALLWLVYSIVYIHIAITYDTSERLHHFDSKLSNLNTELPTASAAMYFCSGDDYACSYDVMLLYGCSMHFFFQDILMHTQPMLVVS